MRNFERRKRIFLVSLNYAKMLNHEIIRALKDKNATGNSDYPNRIVDMTLFQTIQEAIGGSISESGLTSIVSARRDAYDPIALLTILLFAHARYGYAPWRQLERNESLRSAPPMASSG